jgi:hypothetical protein
MDPEHCLAAAAALCLLAGRSIESENIRASYDWPAVMNAIIKNRSRAFCVGAKDFGELRPSVRTNGTSQQRGKSTS